MKIAIDSYCYHRQFGDWYPELQQDPGTRMTVWDFLDRAHALHVQGVSLESCYLPEPTDRFLGELADRLVERMLEPVWAWGHPNGLHSGHSPDAEDDLVRHLAFARRIGARVMRICAGGRRTRPADWDSHRAAMPPVLRRIADRAARAGIVLAIENHIDLLADELAELVETAGNPALGVCLDTGNNLRLFEDPTAVARRLAPHTRATHVKNLTARRGNPRDFAFWPSLPLDVDALVDLPAILRLLRAAGYAGLLAIEVDYLHPDLGGDEDGAVARSVAWLRRQIDAEAAGT